MIGTDWMYSFLPSRAEYSGTGYYLLCQTVASLTEHAATESLFLLRSMKCRRGIAMRILSVCPSVCLPNACIVTKWMKDVSRFLYNLKDHLA